MTKETVKEKKTTLSSTKSKKVVKELSSFESVPEPVVESVPVVKSVSVVESVPVVEQVNETATQVIDNNVVLEESNIEILFNKLVNQFQDIQSVMKTLACNLKIIQKEVLRERKESKKKESKIKKKSDKKKNPSGFAKPAPISSELATFLGLSSNDIIARTDVTTKVIAYVKEHNLQNPENKKQIIPDTKLKNLLQPGDSEINFFNLQTYLKKHFPQSTTLTSTVVESTVV